MSNLCGWTQFFSTGNLFDKDREVCPPSLHACNEATVIFKPKKERTIHFLVNPRDSYTLSWFLLLLFNVYQPKTQGTRQSENFNSHHVCHFFGSSCPSQCPSLVDLPLYLQDHMHMLHMCLTCGEWRE